RREAVTNFEVDKTVRHVRQASGQIRRLTAAVVVNHKTAPAAAGAPAAPTPLSKEELANITALAREAMGFNEQRGDSLNVVNAQFSAPEFGPVEPVPLWKQPDAIALAKEAGKALLFLLLTLIVVFGVVRPALRHLAARPLPPAPAADNAAAPALPQPSDPNAAQMSPLEQVRQLAKNDPATVANVVRAWVGSEPKGS
ncbi:MAG TPA: flagellar M-ring protein FliF C-terminal domain-containing protein, partial [Burkholderiaceae bacterium]|nr:flagellar M-ring protein FliF C-terminal domain-containing protein [Burkholderiaceae bacterium]